MQDNGEKYMKKNNLVLKCSQIVETRILCGCSKILVFKNEAHIDLRAEDNQLVRKISPGILNWTLRTHFKSWTLMKVWNKRQITRTVLQASVLLIPAVSL